MRLARRTALAGAGAWLALPAHAQERVKAGTVEIEQVQVAFIGSGTVATSGLVIWREFKLTKIPR